MFDTRRLLLLVEVVRTGSITAAATRLSFTTSAVSQQLSKLEIEAGQPLLERHARGVRLTEAGEVLVRHAERIETQLLAARNELEDLSGLRAGTLRIGTFPTAGASLLPPVVKLFKSRHLAVALTVRSSRFAGLRGMLDTREVELSLLWDYEWARITDSDLTVHQLMIDPPMLVVSVNHHLAERSSIHMNELEHEQWITREDTHPVGAALERACHAAGFSPSVSFAANDYQEAQAMVAVDLGVSFAPRMALSNIRDDVRLVPLTGAPSRRILLAHLAEQKLSPSATVLLKMFEDVAARF
ncbi:LysR family transcriptional regulator [Rhodococcus sp. 06-470-2]|uniref:LysR family transcriptional regulator n=1 Tax=unclassified Rhodococcus (in: high G+C Gram-positive bacteria) TaxID=192944 RepID=UPI000B9AD821|nr:MULTISPECIES: LysR family transcriptional regulator [unclassified Rhodococcus (in: high G+C Gram-positive bacteria)]OZC57989.1 LysR family transcriptional regulator [Rhodococcus sp. 06-470-2]OZE55002.1 LysR family transcriptional regulator [Rhodococcus sp. 05-2221-1B]